MAMAMKAVSGIEIDSSSSFMGVVVTRVVLLWRFFHKKEEGITQKLKMKIVLMFKKE